MNPFLPDQQERELQRLKQEVGRRSSETTKEAQRRSEQYSKAREQNGVLLMEFTKAFDFTLIGRDDQWSCDLCSGRDASAWLPAT